MVKNESYEMELARQAHWNSTGPVRLEKVGMGYSSIGVPHSWHEAYAAALTESDLGKLAGRIEYAMNAIERRYSEWDDDPGTPAELTATQKCLCALKRLMTQGQATACDGNDKSP